MGLDLRVAGLWTAVVAVAWEDSKDTTKRGKILGTASSTWIERS